MFVHHNMKFNHQKGFSLLEVLIAFIILAVGLLGIVNLQAMSKQFTHQASQRTIAVSLADAIVERIRVNPGALLTYTNSASVGGDEIAAEPNPDCSSEVCSITELATHDLWEWEEALDGAAATVGGTNTSGLISPKACFSFSARAGMTRTGFLTVRVQWTGLNSLSDAVTEANTNCNNTAANSDPFRRQVVVNTYVIDEAEL